MRYWRMAYTSATPENCQVPGKKACGVVGVTIKRFFLEPTLDRLVRISQATIIRMNQHQPGGVREMTRALRCPRINMAYPSRLPIGELEWHLLACGLPCLLCVTVPTAPGQFAAVLQKLIGV